jgi:hypothetical protein
MSRDLLSRYAPPPLDADGLTPRQLEERRASLARVFEVRVDVEMTEASAKRDLSMATTELAKRDRITVEQARYVRKAATALLRRLRYERLLQTGERQR